MFAIMKAATSACLLLATITVSITGASANDKPILDAVDANGAEQLQMLEATVNQNSGSLNVEGVRKVGEIYRRELEDIGFAVRWIDMPQSMARGGHLVAERDFGDGPNLLLIGHIDTVFEPDSPFQRFERDGDKLRGPGISDMKGGNAVVIYAMRALIDADAIKGGKVTIFFTGDEESTGTPLAEARKDLIAAGKAADYALNFEGGSPEWAVVGRRGSSKWKLEVTGKRAHSSGIFSDGSGAGAAFEMARILNRFYGEVRGPLGLTFNPGMVAAGSAIDPVGSAGAVTLSGKDNVIAETAIASGGLRFMNDAQLRAAETLMRGIVEDNLPLTSATITFQDRYPAMELTRANEALLDRLNAVHARLGLEPAKSFPPEGRGAADISFVAPYVASMDGLGVAGTGAHTVEEDMDLNSLQQATKRTALLVADLLASDPVK
ncbi:MAG: M20/M25/M40 family metallo-hydrolase [Sphingomonadales bacterium]|nr:M20/M25/M40 family metallo-hydrolase [Sphingomonadales bacterium]